MQYGTLLPMGKVFYLSQVVAHQKELLSNKICDITPTQTIPHEKPGVEDAYEEEEGEIKRRKTREKQRSKLV